MSKSGIIKDTALWQINYLNVRKIHYSMNLTGKMTYNLSIHASLSKTKVLITKN